MNIKVEHVKSYACTLKPIFNELLSVLTSLNYKLFQFTIRSRSLNVPMRQVGIYKLAEGESPAKGEIRRQRAMGHIGHLILLVIVSCQ